MKALLLCLLLIGCATIVNHFDEARSTTVLVRTDGHGSGNIINDNCIVTAEHVVHGFTTATVMTSDEKTYLLKVVKADENRDVAYLCSPQKLNGNHIVFARHDPVTYSHVFTIGFPLGGKWFMTEGKYQGDDMISAECAPGNSGGGVFNDEGKYIGMVDAIMTEGGHYYSQLCAIVPASEVRAFLDEHHVSIYGVEQ